MAWYRIDRSTGNTTKVSEEEVRQKISGSYKSREVAIHAAKQHELILTNLFANYRWEWEAGDEEN